MTTRNKHYALLAGVALFAGAGGLLAGRAMDRNQPAEAAAEAGEHAEEGEEGHAEENPLALDDARIRAAGIELVRAEDGQVAEEFIAQGTVAPTATGQAVLTAGAPGRIVSLRKRLGDPVGQGEVVATLSSGEAATLTANVGTAQARARLAAAEFARERRLFQERVTARADLERAQAELEAANAEVSGARAAAATAGATGGQLAVRSPTSGRVTEVAAVLGSFVQPEAELFRIADPSAIQIEAALPVAEAARVAAGTPAIVELPGGDEIPARVRAVTPTADLASRAATVVLDLSTGPQGLRPGQFVRVRLRLAGAEASAGVIVPADAVQSIEGRDTVFVRTREGFAPRAVVVARRSGARALITEGLRPGETVAGRNAFLLKAELAKGEAGDDH